MDEGPFRGSRPADRRVVSRQPEPTYRQPEEQQKVVEEPKTVHRAAPTHAKDNKKSSKRFLPFIIGAIIVLLAIFGWMAFSNSRNSATAIDGGKYQAVFFTNGQVYFGKLKPLNDENMQLTDIYYLQTKSTTGNDANPQQTSNDQSDVQLIKLGDEIHGPEDKMIISKDQVLFYENLKTDGKVAQSIASFKKK